MALPHSIVRDLAIAGMVQSLALLFSFSVLDLGGFAIATERLSAAYWCGVVIVLVRRHNSLTRGDRIFLRFGLFAILAAGLPVTLSLWAYRGAL